MKQKVDDVEVRSSTKQRARASAQAFIEGFFGEKANNTSLTTDNDLLRFYDNCSKYVENVKYGNHTYDQRDEFFKSQQFETVVARVQKKTGLPIPLPKISLIWQICR